MIARINGCFKSAPNKQNALNGEPSITGNPVSTANQQSLKEIAGNSQLSIDARERREAVLKNEKNIVQKANYIVKNTPNIAMSYGLFIPGKVQNPAHSFTDPMSKKSSFVYVDRDGSGMRYFDGFTDMTFTIQDNKITEFSYLKEDYSKTVQNCFCPCLRETVTVSMGDGSVKTQQTYY